MNNPQILIAALADAPEIIIGLVREVPSQNLKRRPSPNKWSAHEHACHLTTADVPYRARLELMLSDPRPKSRRCRPRQKNQSALCSTLTWTKRWPCMCANECASSNGCNSFLNPIGNGWQHTKSSVITPSGSCSATVTARDAARLPNRRATAEKRLAVTLTSSLPLSNLTPH